VTSVLPTPVALAVASEPVPAGRAGHEALRLVVRLCAELRRAGVSYCHWKSNNALHLSACGVNDLDLLVDRGDWSTFLSVLGRLGFKEGLPPNHRKRPGVRHLYGLDEPTGTLVHVDAQCELWLGDDTTKNVRLPMERAYLASSRQTSLFSVPAPEFELAVLVVRLALKHGTWDAAAFRLARFSTAERREVDFLRHRADLVELRRVVEQHLHVVGWPRWWAFLQALLEGASLRRQLRAGRRLVAPLAVYARRRPALDTVVRCERRVEWGLRRFVLGQRNVKRLASGGALVAVVGGDGAGKSTAVDGLAGWLGGPFKVRTVHLGKPGRSALSLATKATLAAWRRSGLRRGPWLPNYPTPEEHRDQPPGLAWLAWQLVTARDRRREHRRARRLAARGALVVCDRFPLPQITLMDGSRTRWVRRDDLSRLARWLVDREQRCYAEMTGPDVLVVLRVDPDLAVARKQGVDAPEFVRPRSAEVFDADWSSSDAVVLDAALAGDEVLAQLRAVVWERL
jgi:thymidylate kinase